MLEKTEGTIKKMGNTETHATWGGNQRTKTNITHKAKEMPNTNPQ